MLRKFYRPDLRWMHILVGAAGMVMLLVSAPSPAQNLPAQTASALHDIPLLRAAVERFAGGPARLDPRLVVPRCPAPALSWARADVVRADCAVPAWTLYVPVQPPAGAAAAIAPTAAERAERARPAIRRGDRVLVEAAGPGFAVAMEAEAERDSDGTRIALKSAAGRRILARIDADGRIVLNR